jgi:hypothetical protein
LKRFISDSEKVYERVKRFVNLLPTEIVASLRVEFCKPKVIDSLRSRIKREVGTTVIEHKDGWSYSFMYGELEFNEFMRQLL